MPPPILIDTIAFQGLVRTDLPSDRKLVWENVLVDHVDGVPHGPVCKRWKSPSGAVFTTKTFTDCTNVRVEASLPRRFFGTNLIACTLPQALSTVEALYEEANEQLKWITPLGETLLKRLDLVLDFQGVESLRLLVPALLAHSRAPITVMGSRRKGYSVTRGSKEHRQMGLYDKAAEARSRRGTKALSEQEIDLVRGVARFETRMGKALGKQFDLKTVAQLCEPDAALVLEAVRCDAWSRSGFGLQVVSPELVVETIQANEELKGKGREKGLACWVAICRARGWDPEMDRRTVSRYAGVLPDICMGPDGYVGTVRLDYDTGTEVRTRQRRVAGPLMPVQ